MVPRSLEDFNTFICGEFGEQKGVNGCGRTTYTAYNLIPPYLPIDEKMPIKDNSWGGYGWWSEAHQAAAASQDELLSGKLRTDRAGTELRLCSDCDPHSWKNLARKTKSGLKKLFHGGRVAIEIATLTGEDAGEVFKDIIEPVIQEA